MSFMSEGKVARLRGDFANAPSLPDVILRNESQGDLEELGLVVAEAEERASGSAKPNTTCSKRTRANHLHREADQLYHKGDYESALVLYHRAAKLCPREHSHSVAAWRIQATINSASNPSQELHSQLKEARSPGQMSAVLCPEVAARRARDIVAETPDPVREIPSILRFLESRKDFWRLSSPSTSPRRSRSKMMLKQLNRCVTSTFKQLENAFEAGDSATVHELGNVLMSFASISEESDRKQFDLYGYLACRQITLKRHDRAVNLAVKMIFSARTCGNVLWMTEALVTIGKVHLAFGHLDALIQVWERLVDDLQMEAIPQSWLYHDIGRCHLELGDFEKALNAAKLCLDRANSVKSKKWIVRGHLLTGQSLLKLNKFGEAVVALKAAAITALSEKDEKAQSIIIYVQNLIDQVTCFLRQLNQERDSKVESQKSCNDVSEVDSSSSSCSINKTDDTLQDDNSAGKLIRENFARDKLSPPKQRKRQYRGRTNLESQGNTSDEEMVTHLLERTRVLGRAQSQLMTTVFHEKCVKSSRPTTDAASKLLSFDASKTNEEDVANADINLESSRTRIICRCESERDSDDERTLKDNELVPLSDISCIDDTGEEDFASVRFDDGEMFNADEEESIQSRVSSSSTLRTAHTIVSEDANEKSLSSLSPDEGLTSSSFSISLGSFPSPTSDNRSNYALGMLNYLKGLKSHDFEKLRMEERLFFDERSAN